MQLRLLISPCPSGGPVVETLAYFGKNTSCAGTTVDRQGNIYMTLTQWDNSSVAVVVQLKAGSHRVVQLFHIEANSTDDEPCALTVTPDGQQIFVGLNDGRVLRYKAPFNEVQPQQVGRMHTRVTALFADDNMLWLCDESGVLHKRPLQGGRITASSVPDEWDSLVLSHTASGELCLHGVLGDGPSNWELVKVTLDGKSKGHTPVTIKWPPDLNCDSSCKTVLACSKEGALLVASVDVEDFDANEPAFYYRIFHVAPDGAATIVAGGGDREIEEEEDEEGGADLWEGMSFPDGEEWSLTHHKLTWPIIDGEGRMVAYSTCGHVVRVEFNNPVPPAHLQAPQTDASSSAGISFPSCEPTQLGQDWGALLASGDATDVQLKCAEGAIVKAHSHVLLARCEYYRVLQRNIAAGMTGGVVAGEVDVSEHSAATMQLVLQHLYTGRVQLPAPAAGADSPVNSPAAAVGSSTGGRQKRGSSSGKGSRKRDAAGATKGGAAGEGSSSQGDAAQQQQGSLTSTAPLVQLVPVMRAADALLLPDLRDACLKVAQQQLAPDNALPLLLAAHEAHIAPLEAAAMEFTLKHIKDVHRCKRSPLSIKDIIKSAPDLGAELADSLASALADQ